MPAEYNKKDKMMIVRICGMISVIPKFLSFTLFLFLF